MRRERILFMFVALAATSLPRTSGAAHNAGANPTVEAPSDVEVVAPSDDEGRPPGLATLVGRLHPAMVHFPIVWLVSLAVVDFLGLGLRREFWARAGTITIVAAMASILVAASTGLLLAAHTHEDPPWHALMVKHRTLNLGVASLVAMALVLRFVRRNRLDGPWRLLYLGLIFVSTALVLVAADFGGRMVYGPNYLPF
jgi:uncharacterized membrane protein